MYEACLSIPHLFGKVIRPKKIKISALNENGEEIRINTSGFFARTIQHEMDHLNGVLFTDVMVGEAVNEKQLEDLRVKDRNIEY